MTFSVSESNKYIITFELDVNVGDYFIEGMQQRETHMIHSSEIHVQA